METAASWKYGKHYLDTVFSTLFGFDYHLNSDRFLRPLWIDPNYRLVAFVAIHWI